MSIDVGNNPVGSVPTSQQKNQIRKAIGCAKVPTVLGPVAASMDPDDFYIFGSNMAYVKDPATVTSLDISFSDFSYINFQDLTNLVTLDTRDSSVEHYNLKNLTSLESFVGVGGDYFYKFINFEGCTGLQSVYFYTVGYESVDLSSCLNLTDLYINILNTQSFIFPDADTLVNIQISPGYMWTQGWSSGIDLNLSNRNSLTSFTDADGSGWSPIKTIDLSNCSSLYMFSCSGSAEEITSINLSNCPSLETFSFNNNLPNLTTLNLSGCSGMYSIGLNGSSQLDSINLSGCSFLESVYMQYTGLETLDLTASDSGHLMFIICPFNNLLTTVNIGSYQSILNVNLLDTACSQTTVNNILIGLDNAGLTGGVVNLSEGTSAAPTGDALTAKSNLITKGWTVTTN